MFVSAHYIKIQWFLKITIFESRLNHVLKLGSSSALAIYMINKPRKFHENPSHSFFKINCWKMPKTTEISVIVVSRDDVFSKPLYRKTKIVSVSNPTASDSLARTTGNRLYRNFHFICTNWIIGQLNQLSVISRLSNKIASFTKWNLGLRRV